DLVVDHLDARCFVVNHLLPCQKTTATGPGPAPHSRILRRCLSSVSVRVSIGQIACGKKAAFTRLRTDYHEYCTQHIIASPAHNVVLSLQDLAAAPAGALPAYVPGLL